MEKRFIINSIIFIFSLSFIIGEIQAQINTNRRKEKTNVEKFNIHPFYYAVDKDSVKIVAFLEIPFYCLQFIKQKHNYFASYQASIGIWDKDGDKKEYVVWVDSIIVDDYKITNSFTRNRKHFTSFIIPKNGQYEIIGELQDDDTRKKGILRKEVNLRGYSKTPVLLPPNFLLDLNGDWGFTFGKIPTKGYRVREINDGIDLNISGFLNNSDYEIDIFITNSLANDSLIEKIIDKGETRGYFNKNIFISSKTLQPLKNNFKIKISQNNKSDQKEISFTTYKAGVSRFVSNLDLAFKQMRYILTNEERNLLKDKSKKRREELFYSVWKKRDPTPETEINELMDEYYRRVSYANENFDGWQQGWESDRGMIYILFGPPDDIQRTNSSFSNTSVLQIWNYYNISKQFVFVDQNGFGDYRLDNPFIGAGL